MAIVPHTIDIVVADIAASLGFYRTLGLDAPAEANGPQVQIATPGGATIGLVTEDLVRRTNPGWTAPTGSRVTFACRCDSPEELDATHARVVAAGYQSRQDPWDAFWGQRYAMLVDPDGNRVDLFAAIAEEGVE
jgi:catechol 2,3-dioxygenase-like lactoylglutathione lyase family enzyme